jgi:uncharacterized membrane protein
VKLVGLTLGHNSFCAHSLILKRDLDDAEYNYERPVWPLDFIVLLDIACSTGTSMGTLQEEKQIRRYFRISVLIKGFISLLEVIGGLLAFVIPPSAVTNIVIAMSQDELSEEPGDFIASHSLQIAQHFTIASGTVIGIYLLTRGLIKLGLVFALLKNQLWAYPASLVVLGLFILYQAYLIVLSHSLIIITITIFDLIVVYFIWREYGILREHLKIKTN